MKENSENHTLPKALEGCNLTERKDFAWGINIKHASGYPAYKPESTEKMVLLAKDMGCKILRIGYDAENVENMDKTVRFANECGMDLMLCHYAGIAQSDEEYSADYYYNLFKSLANRYNGKNGHGVVKYFQIDNEVDLWVMHTAFAESGKVGGDGREIENFDISLLESARKKFEVAIKGVKDADSDAKTVINFAWEHYGMLQYMYENGIEWDVTGYDWYGDMAQVYINNGRTAFDSARTVYEKWGKEIIICETNQFYAEAFDETDPESWNILYEIMKDAYKMDFVKGCIFYELVDELYYEHETYERESHFGFIGSDKDCNLGEPKAVYYAVKEALNK